MLAECAYNISKAANEVLLDSLLGGTNLNYIVHEGCMRRASVDRRKHWELLETKVLTG